MENIFDFLDDYFKKTPKEVLKEKFDRYNNSKYEGVTVKQYFQNFAEQHNFLPSLIDSQKKKAKNHGISVFSEQIQEAVSSLPVDTKVNMKQDISFACKTGENLYAIAA